MPTHRSGDAAYFGFIAQPAPALIGLVVAMVVASLAPFAQASTLWSPSTVPATTSFDDSYSYELGVKFESSVSGYITGVRFYKGAGNTGTHIGHLWTASGTLLASATFTNESSSGWQTVSFSSPVAITANTVYVASYWDPEGHYALSRPYFTSAYSNPPLEALASGTDGPNGVYFSGSSSGFPTGSYEESNYWVDVLFALSTSAAADATTQLLSGSPSSLSFGDVSVGTSSTLPVVITNTGTGSVTISTASASGTGFSVSAPTLPLTVASGQDASFSVTFEPTAAGSDTGELSVTSNASNSPTVTSLSGTGVSTPASVSLSWTASTSTGVVGYYVFRGTVSGGPYTQLNSSPVDATTYTDTTVEAGETYYYVTTAVTSQGTQSAYSNQAEAVVPSS